MAKKNILDFLSKTRIRRLYQDLSTLEEMTRGDYEGFSTKFNECKGLIYILILNEATKRKRLNNDKGSIH